jgi:chemotaxis protein CheX
MKSANEFPAVGCNREDWPPIMEQAAREVFEMMLGTKLTTPDAPLAGPFDATSMVGLAGQVCGILTFSCDAKAAMLMASKMLDAPATEVSREVLDALGEVCNMVAGNFKNKFPA